MRILFITHYFFPEGNAPATRVHALTRRWAAQGHEVTVLTGTPNVPNGIPYDGYRNSLIRRESVDGVNVIRVWTYLAPNRGTIRRTLNYLSFMASAVVAGVFRRSPDVIIATSPQFFCGWAGVILSKLKRIPFILEIRDIWPESIAAVGAIRGRGAISFLERLERAMYASANAIVTVGDGYKDQLVARGVQPSRITVIPNGIEPAQAPTQSIDIRKQYNLQKQFIVSFVGTIGMACGLDVVLRACTILRDKGIDDITFMLVGDGAVRQTLKQQAEAQGLTNVIFTGLLPKTQALATIAASDACLVHLKNTELFRTVLPSKMLEAMGMGKPVLLGVSGYASDLLREADAGICFDPEDERALVSAVTRLAGDPDEARRMGQAGKAFVETHFNMKSLAVRYMELLRRICKPL